MLDRARSTHANPSARGPPSAKAPSKVGVLKGADPDPLISPREVLDCTGLQHPVPSQPQESRQVRR
eukprot:9260939-Alexandrium_andersonii.AAC.1